ncbi:MAG: hypothetical protein A3H44_14320 [Gammaproteobacteria bacterium RIFCSPLOWO2_02_FULL_57_10]|nr:MAG: hypothetical protein A3H44_14320 [Gammaproteobacteria bacterium RIFCSPLOWO2_02_FULL_57_10]
MSTTLLPITVIAAILIFFVKELLEYVRSKKKKSKKLAVYKRMIAEEIEINKTALGSLSQTLSTIRDGTDERNRIPRIIRTPSGALRIEFKEDDEDYGSGWPIPPISKAVFEKLYLELAELDPSFFEESARTYEAVAEIKHIRDSLIDYIEEDTLRPNGFLNSFAEWGEGQLEHSKSALSDLYFKCTGKQLERGRLRSFA